MTEQRNQELHDQNVRELAYEKWQDAGTPPGDGVKFWLEAEKELLAQAQNQISTTKKKPQPEERAAAKKSNRG